MIPERRRRTADAQPAQAGPAAPSDRPCSTSLLATPHSPDAHHLARPDRSSIASRPPRSCTIVNRRTTDSSTRPAPRCAPPGALEAVTRPFYGSFHRSLDPLFTPNPPVTGAAYDQDARVKAAADSAKPSSWIHLHGNGLTNRPGRIQLPKAPGKEADIRRTPLARVICTKRAPGRNTPGARLPHDLINHPCPTLGAAASTGACRGTRAFASLRASSTNPTDPDKDSSRHSENTATAACPTGSSDPSVSVFT